MGETLYERLSKVQIMFGVMSQDLRPQFPPSAPAWLANLACQCWAANPAARSALLHTMLLMCILRHNPRDWSDLPSLVLLSVDFHWPGHTSLEHVSPASCVSQSQASSLAPY